MAEILKTDKLNEGRQKLNDAIKQAENAEQVSNEAKQTADTVKSEFDAVVERATDSDAMSRQAAIDETGHDHVNLKARLDNQHAGVTAQLAQTQQQKADKTYVEDRIFEVNQGGEIDISHKANVEYVNQRVATPRPKILLDIPTYDGNPSHAHPAVVHIPTGWNGYTYWMVHTPYPNEPRENPCVVVSNDGVNWIEPEGIINPVVPYIQGTHHSDPHFVFIDNNTLAMYYRTSSPEMEALYRITSTDGVNWSEKEFCIRNEVRRDELLSPAVVKENDGTYSMYTVRVVTQDTNHKIQKRTSSNGIDWSAPVDVTSNITFVPWHLDVVKHDNQYHMLVSDRAKWRIYYLYSNDGLDWIQPSNHPSIHLSGEDYDKNGHYKAAFVPRVGQPLTWDIWVTGMNAVNSIYTTDAVWSTILYRDVNLKVGTLETLNDVKVSKSDVSRVFIPAKMFDGTIGTPTYSVLQNKTGSWLFDKASVKVISSVTEIPKYWKRTKISVLVINRSESVELGTVKWRVARECLTPDQLIFPTDVNYTRILRVTSPVKPFNAVQIATLLEDDVITTGVINYRVEREINDIDDTFQGTLAVIGLFIERVN